MKNLTIKETPLEDIWQMRRSIMYPNESIEFVKLEDDGTGMHWGLYENGQLISVISLFLKGNELQFRKFATAVPLQGKGYGTYLLNHVMDWAVNNQVNRVWCNARATATRLYEKLGMRAVGTGWQKYGLDFIMMEKTIEWK